MKKYVFFLWIVLAFGLTCCVDDSGSDQDSSGNGVSGSMARFAVRNNHLYVVDPSNLQSFDISDSSRIVRTSLVPVNDRDVETLFSTDSLLFLGTTQGMYIYSIKNPDKPTYVSLYTHVVSCDPVVVQGRYAYVTMHTDLDGWSCNRGVNQLEVIDITRIQNPVSSGVYPMDKPLGLGVDGNLLFVCDGMSIVVMDNTNPLELVKKKTIELDETPYDLIARNGLLTVTCTNGVRQYAYANDTLTLLSTLY